jgi:hypothetical protein
VIHLAGQEEVCEGGQSFDVACFSNTAVVVFDKDALIARVQDCFSHGSAPRLVVLADSSQCVTI